ncbi:phage tail protein [Rhizobium sp. AG855]|uniref:phage tail protein n=1 Tax=Rhizobium sp. AG855 TaxID=2183898 RepID=UPI000FF10A88|nr:phage tail protein [Rhizobium sp. AG855]RKE84599.1 putative tail protein [Rhizobium sp. AG855]
MKVTRLLLHCGASYLAMAASASADPVSLIATAIQGFLLTSTGIAATLTGTIATIAANAIIAGGLFLGSSLLSRSARGGAVKPSDAKSNFETGQSSVIEGVGRVRVGGLKAFGNTNGSTRARLICHLQGPIDAIEQYYLGQREVTVESDGSVSSPPWSKSGGSWANWLVKLGTGDETQWAGIASILPSGWTSAHRVRGIAQSQLLFYNPGLTEPKYLSLYQNGTPEAEVVCRAAKVFDPRDLTQVSTNVATWKWSDNGPLVCAHVLRRDPRFDSTRFNWEKIGATATEADALVATKTGTEKRSRLWGMWAWESERGETMKQFLESSGLEIRLDENGLIYFEFIDDAPEAEISFTPDDMYDFYCSDSPEAVSLPNICRIKYYSPERLYEIAEINLDGIGWARIDAEVERYGPKYFDIELPFCPSASQAQRIGRRLFAQARAARGAITTNMVGLAAWGLLYADITEPDLGDVERVRMDAPRVDDENGSVEIPFMVWPALSVWNPAVDEADAPDSIPELGYQSDLITPNAPSEIIQITYPGGAKELRIGFSLPSQTYDNTEANFRVYSGDIPGAWQSMAETPAPNSAICAYASGDYLGQTVDGRVRVFNVDEGSSYSPNFKTVVTAFNATPSVPTQVSASTSPSTAGINVVTKHTETRVASLKMERQTNASGSFGAWSLISQQDARPGQNITFNDSITIASGRTVNWRISAVTSDGSTSAYLSYSVVKS